MKLPATALLSLVMSAVPYEISDLFSWQTVCGHSPINSESLLATDKLHSSPNAFEILETDPEIHPPVYPAEATQRSLPVMRR